MTIMTRLCWLVEQNHVTPPTKYGLTSVLADQNAGDAVQFHNRIEWERQTSLKVSQHTESQPGSVAISQVMMSPKPGHFWVERGIRFRHAVVGVIWGIGSGLNKWSNLMNSVGRCISITMWLLAVFMRLFFFGLFWHDPVFEWARETDKLGSEHTTKVMVSPSGHMGGCSKYKMEQFIPHPNKDQT